MYRTRKQLVVWNEEIGMISAIDSFTEDQAESRLKRYVTERITELFHVSVNDAENMMSRENEDVIFDHEALTTEIVFPGGEYREYIQVIDLPDADTISIDTSVGKLEASVNDGSGSIGIDVCLFTGEDGTDILDVARVSLWTDKVCRTKMMEKSNDIRIMSFYDPYDEDYPNDGLHILYGSEIKDAFGNGEDTSNKEEPTPDWEGADIVAYTDGSYNKATGCYGAGVVMFEKEGRPLPKFRKKKGTAPDGENGWQVNGEVTAAEIAIEEAVKAGARSLEIRYDYEGVEYWATGKWKRNKTYTKEYAEFVRKAKEKLTIMFSHVKGHSGDKWNDVADSLAKKACGVES